MIFFSNVLANSIIKSSCPEIYREIEFTVFMYDPERALSYLEIDTKNKDEDRTIVVKNADNSSGTNSEFYNDGFYDDMI